MWVKIEAKAHLIVVSVIYGQPGPRVEKIDQFGDAFLKLMDDLN